VHFLNEPRRQLVALHAEPEFRSKLRGLRNHDVEVRFVDTWEGLRQVAQEASPATLLLVDPYHANGKKPEPTLHDLLRTFPSLVVLAAIPRDADMADVCTLGRWGVADVIQIELEDTTRLLLRRLREVRARPLNQLLHADFPGPLPGRARAILETAVDVALQGGLPRDMADRMGMDGSTLRRWCALSQLPPPRKLLLWMRSLIASMLLDDPGHTIFSAALACGYNSDQAMRRALQRSLPMTPSELREIGAFETVASAFHQEVLRPPHREQLS